MEKLPKEYEDPLIAVMLLRRYCSENSFVGSKNGSLIFQQDAK